MSIFGQSLVVDEVPVAFGLTAARAQGLLSCPGVQLQRPADQRHRMQTRHGVTTQSSAIPMLVSTSRICSITEVALLEASSEVMAVPLQCADGPHGRRALLGTHAAA